MAGGLAAVLVLPVLAGVKTYKIDPQHSSAQFAVTHLVISKVRGEFHAVNGTVSIDDGDITKSSVEVTIDASTVDTREPDRDKDLKSPHFLDVAKYPLMSFKSTKVEKERFWKASRLPAILRFMASRNPLFSTLPSLTLPIKDPWGLQRTAISGSTKINRQDFGLNYSPTLDNGGLVVGNEVEITLDVEMIVPSAK